MFGTSLAGGFTIHLLDLIQLVLTKGIAWQLDQLLECIEPILNNG
jgi:hypothetical protein